MDRFLLPGHAKPLFLHLESLIDFFLFFFFTIRINVWDISWTYFFFFNIQNIKSNCLIVFHKSFPIIYFWWMIYSFFHLCLFINGLTFETSWMWFNFFIIWCNSLPHIGNIYHLFLLLFFLGGWGRIFCYFFLFYSVWKVNIWTTSLKYYFMTFIIQKIVLNRK